MKTLTIKNPWAWLILSGGKNIENRTWRTRYRGRFLIHAGATWDPGGPALPLFVIPPESAIIGSVDLVDCIQDSRSPWAMPGYWHWVLKNPILFDKPIRNIKGALSFWDFPIELYPHIKAA